MSNPTSNFGWQMPTPTDLVTDLPADFEVFGQAVDSDFADLLGGTTGQVLSKTSNTDLDFTWVAANPGDITGVTAGTGISGGGTSGTVTVTNDMATTITASGDIVVGTGSGTYDNLPIGTTGQILTADTTVSPYKVKWATPAAPSFVGVKLKDATPQSIANTTQVILTFDNETFDTNGFHDNATNNSRITIPAGYAGYYRITCNAAYAANATGIRYIIVYKNGSSFQEFSQQGSSEDVNCTYTFVANLAVADYIQFNCFQNSGGSLNINKNNLGVFEAQYLGA